MAEAFSRCQQSFKWHFHVDVNLLFLASLRLSPPCDVFADALPPIGPFHEHQSGLQPWACNTMSKTMRCGEVETRMRAGVPSSHSIKSGLNLVAEERWWVIQFCNGWSHYSAGRISGDEGNTTNCAWLGVKIALYTLVRTKNGYHGQRTMTCVATLEGRRVESQIASLMKPRLS